MPTLGFLHTSPVHTPTFDALVAGVAGGSVQTTVVVDEALLDRARSEGVDSADVHLGVSEAIAELEAAGASMIVCTCSTIGGLAEELADTVPVVRVDRAMAEAAVASGPRVAVIAALESTLAPTEDLLRSVALEQETSIDFHTHLVNGAWRFFEVGDIDGYLESIAAACERLAESSDVIVLAQASMAAAAVRCDIEVPILSSPSLAVEAAVRALS